jgi:hypothetical protein
MSRFTSACANVALVCEVHPPSGVGVEAALGAGGLERYEDSTLIEACLFNNFFSLRGSLCLSFLGNFGFFM